MQGKSAVAIYKARQAIDQARNTLAKACERLEARR
jgi:hypothetical protein